MAIARKPKKRFKSVVIRDRVLIALIKAEFVEQCRSGKPASPTAIATTRLMATYNTTPTKEKKRVTTH